MKAFDKKNCNCGDHVVPAPQPLDKSCACKPARVTFRTKTIPANLGDDTGSYKPEPGSAYDTLVVYLANGAIYFYDSNGVFSKVRDGYADADHELLHSFASKIEELYDPIVPHTQVESYADLASIQPGTIPSDAYVSVMHDETHDYREVLYFYDAGTREWVMYDYASPYYTKDVMDELLDSIEQRLALETANRIDADEKEQQARIAADDKLTEDLAAEAKAREDADKEINDRITDIQNSPDVRFIVDTYTDLQAIDKSGVADKDYARVLQDETHEGASTYYQFALSNKTWDYVGMTGPYYTKQEVDDKFSEVEQQIGDINDALIALDTGEGVE